MKTKVCSLMLIVALVLSLGISAGAANRVEISPLYEGVVRCTPVLTFSGKTATCSAAITAAESSATITGTMTLYKIESNGILTRIISWGNLTGTGRLAAGRTYSVPVTGYTYRLTISATVKDSTGSHFVSAYRDTYCPSI